MALASLPTGGKILPMQIRQSAIPAVTERIVQGAANMFNEWEKTKAAHKQEFMEKASAYDISKKMTGELTAKARAANAQDMLKLTEIYSRRSDFFGRVSPNDEELNSYINAMTERQAYIADIDKTLKEENEKLKLAETKQGEYNEVLIRENIKKLEGFLSKTDLESTQQEMAGVNKGFWRAANNQDPEGTSKGFSYSMQKGDRKTVDSEFLDWKNNNRNALEAGKTELSTLATENKQNVVYNKASDLVSNKVIAGNREFTYKLNSMPVEGSTAAVIFADPKAQAYMQRSGLSKWLAINPNQLKDGVQLDLKYDDYDGVEQTLSVTKDTKIGEIFPEAHNIVKEVKVIDLLKQTGGDISKGVDYLAKNYLVSYEEKDILRSIPTDRGGKNNKPVGTPTNANYINSAGKGVSHPVVVWNKPMQNMSGKTKGVDINGNEYILDAKEGKIIGETMDGKALIVAVSPSLSSQYKTDETDNLVLYDKNGAEISSGKILVNKAGQKITYETAQENIANGINDITDFSYDGNPIGVKSNEGKLINDKFYFNKEQKMVYIPSGNMPQYGKGKTASIYEIQEFVKEHTGVYSPHGESITQKDKDKMSFDADRGKLPKREQQVYDLKIKQAEKDLEGTKDLITISNAISQSFVEDAFKKGIFIKGSNGEIYKFDALKKAKGNRYALPVGLQTNRYIKVEDETGREMYVDYDYWIKTEFNGNKGAFLKDYLSK